MTGYQHLIYTCPDHDSDLDDEGLGMYYCPAGQHWLPFSYVVGDDDRGTDG